LIAESTNQCRSRCSNSYAASATAKPAVTCKSMIDTVNIEGGSSSVKN